MLNKEVIYLYKLKKILNYNGTYRLEDNIVAMSDWYCEIMSILLPDMCAKLIVFNEGGSEESIVTSPIRQVMGTLGKTDLTIKTQNTIYELELIKEDE